MLEKKVIEEALLIHGTTRAAASALGVDQSTLVKKQKRWRIEQKRDLPNDE